MIWCSTIYTHNGCSNLFQIIFESEQWCRFFDSTKDNEHLNNLAHQLPDIVKNSRAVSTTRQYAYSFKNWTSWCCKYQKSPLLADPYAIALYLTELRNKANSSSPINDAIAGILGLTKWPMLTLTLHKLRLLRILIMGGSGFCQSQSLRRSLLQQIKLKSWYLFMVPTKQLIIL